MLSEESGNFEIPCNYISFLRRRVTEKNTCPIGHQANIISSLSFSPRIAFSHFFCFEVLSEEPNTSRVNSECLLSILKLF